MSNEQNITNMQKIGYLLIFMCLSGITMSAIAQVDERFVGKWKLESAEVREFLFENSRQVGKVPYALGNVGEILNFNAITEMKLWEEQETADDYNFITTAAMQYQNPLVQVSERYFEFSDQINSEKMNGDRYEYTFITPEKLLLISHEIFYPKNGIPMKAQLYLTLSRLSE